MGLVFGTTTDARTARVVEAGNPRGLANTGFLSFGREASGKGEWLGSTTGPGPPDPKSARWGFPPPKAPRLSQRKRAGTPRDMAIIPEI